MLNSVSFISFYQYLLKEYNKIFVSGESIIKFSDLIFVEKDKTLSSFGTLGLVNYKDITKIFIMALNIDNKVDTFYDLYNEIISQKHIDTESEKMHKLYVNDNTYSSITNAHKEAFDYAYMSISKIKSPKYAIQCFKDFIENGDYRVFTRNNNIRQTIKNSNLTRGIVTQIMSSEEERLLLEASLETFSKHGIEQLKGAFNYAKDGDYSGFSRNSRNEFALFVKLKENSYKYLPNLAKYIKFEKSDKIVYDLTELGEFLENFKEDIESIEIYANKFSVEVKTGKLNCEVKDIFY